MSECKIGVIGLDTSHSVEFVRLMQGDAAPEHKVTGMRAVKAMRFPSVFQPEDGQDKRQAQLEEWGVTVGTSLEEAVDGVDAILLELNDPATHLEYFEKVAALGKPVFLDKPMAGTLEDGKKIAALAKQHNTRVWGASSLRFVKSMEAACAAAPEPTLCNVYGALGKAAAGSDLVWYGIHTVEMLATIMGTGAQTVSAHKGERGIVLIVEYAEGRRGVVECNAGTWFYGGRVQNAEKIVPFAADGEVLYANMMPYIRDFFLGGDAPVSLETMLEIQAILDAGERSLESGKSETLAL